jgi:hypothetical protein
MAPGDCRVIARRHKRENPVYAAALSFGCLFGLHRPMLTSIIRRQDRFTGLCDTCGLPIERPNDGRWTSPMPLASQRDQTA